MNFGWVLKTTFGLGWVGLEKGRVGLGRILKIVFGLGCEKVGFRKLLLGWVGLDFEKKPQLSTPILRLGSLWEIYNVRVLNGMNFSYHSQ